jgi:hypothetical protein
VTQQQPREPNILPPQVQAAWDVWCDARINSHLDSFTEVIAEEVGTTTGQHAKTIFEILDILGLLVKGKGNEFIAGRLHQITKEFKHQNETIEREVETVETRTIEQQRTSKVQQVVRVIDSILAH